MPKTKKRKSKSCNRGYPCGGSCISRGYNCRKKLKGQANSYANWLKKSGENLGARFNKEAGTRLSKEVNSISKVNKPTTISDGLKGLLDTVNKLEEVALINDRKMLKYHEKSLQNSIRDIKKYPKDIVRYKKEIAQYSNKLAQKQSKIAKSSTLGDLKYSKQMLEYSQSSYDWAKKNKVEASAQIAALTRSIPEREQKIAKALPKNKIEKFSRLGAIDKEFRDLKSDRAQNIARKMSDMDRLKNQLNDITEEITGSAKTNKIVPFKKKRSQDFAEQKTSWSLITIYQQIRSRFDSKMNEVYADLEAIVNAT